MCRGISHIHSLELGMFMKQPALDVLNCVAERMCMEEDMDDVSLFNGYAVWSLRWTDANEMISMICNFDETDILFVCFGIMELHGVGL